MDKLFRINNTDTLSEMKAITIDFESSLVYILGEDDVILDTVNITIDDILIWLSVDPMTSKYPHLSPYNYCNNNPLRYIDPDGREWVDIDGNKIKDHTKIKVYIFYDPKSFGRQSKGMAKMAENTYGKGSVAMSNVTTEVEFLQDWKDMASSDVKVVNLNYHGGPQTLNLNWKTGDYITSYPKLENGTSTTPRGVSATHVSDLPTPIGNISNARLNINSCQSNNAASVTKGITLAQSFRNTTDFISIRCTSKGVSYFFLQNQPNMPHPQDHSSWQILPYPNFYK